MFTNKSIESVKRCEHRDESTSIRSAITSGTVVNTSPVGRQLVLTSMSHLLIAVFKCGKFFAIIALVFAHTLPKQSKKCGNFLFLSSDPLISADVALTLPCFRSKKHSHWQKKILQLLFVFDKLDIRLVPSVVTWQLSTDAESFLWGQPLYSGGRFTTAQHWQDWQTKCNFVCSPTVRPTKSRFLSKLLLSLCHKWLTITIKP